MSRRSVSFIGADLPQELPNHKYFDSLQSLISDLHKIKEKHEVRNWKSEKINEYLFLSWLIKTLSKISAIFLDKINSGELDDATNTVYNMMFLDIQSFQKPHREKIKEIIEKFYTTLTINIIIIDGKTEKGFVHINDFSSGADIEIQDIMKFKKLFLEWLFQENYPKSTENAHRILINNIISDSLKKPIEKESSNGFLSNVASISSGFFSQSASSKRFSNDPPSFENISRIGAAYSNADFLSSFSGLFELQGGRLLHATEFQRNLMKNLIEQFWVESQACVKLDTALANKNREIPQEVITRIIPENILNAIMNACFLDFQPHFSFVSSFRFAQGITPENRTPPLNPVLMEACERTPIGSFAAK